MQGSPFLGYRLGKRLRVAAADNPQLTTLGSSAPGGKRRATQVTYRNSYLATTVFPAFTTSFMAVPPGNSGNCIFSE